MTSAMQDLEEKRRQWRALCAGRHGTDIEDIAIDFATRAPAGTVRVATLSGDPQTISADEFMRSLVSKPPGWRPA
jgi:hypothetical protein